MSPAIATSWAKPLLLIAKTIAKQITWWNVFKKPASQWITPMMKSYNRYPRRMSMTIKRRVTTRKSWKVELSQLFFKEMKHTKLSFRKLEQIFWIHDETPNIKVITLQNSIDAECASRCGHCAMNSSNKVRVPPVQLALNDGCNDCENWWIEMCCCFLVSFGKLMRGCE